MANYTPNYNFYLPIEGDSRANGRPWAKAINNNFIDLDSRLKLHSDGLGLLTNNQGVANGLATLDSNAKLKLVQLPTIGNSNIQDLSAAKISGQLLDLQIAALSASKITGRLIASQLGDSIIDQTKMAAGLRVPVVVNFLPTLPDAAYPLGSIVTLSSDGKLYRSLGTSWTASVPTVDLTGTIAGNQLANNAVDITKLASGLRPPRIVATLPVSPFTGYIQGDTVVLTTDNKLYRFTGTDFIASVPTADLTGTVTDAQIAGMAASKVTGQLNDSQLAAIAAAKLTGQITGTQITDGAISTPKLAAGSVTAAVIAADTITAANIAAGAITSSELATGAVIAGKIAAGTIQAIDIAANTITAGQIAANTITAGQIAADTITAAQIAAGAITATELAAGSVVAGKIAAGAVTANEIAANTITSSQIAADSITAGSIAAGAIGASEIAAGAIIAGKIAAGSIGATEIIAGSITTSLLNFTPVQSTNVVASINASAEGIRISGSKITIDGTVSFTSGYDPTTKIASGGAATDINNNTTTINGGKITTGTITTTQLNFTPVLGTNVVASINASAEGIRISGSKITIDGTVSFTSGYDPSTKIASGGAATDINNNATTISGGKITTGTITASQLSTDLAIVNVIRSTNYVAGTSSAVPVGLKLSGTAFTTTFLGGTTDTSCQFELGGSANLAGFRTIGVVARSMSAIGDNGLTGLNFRSWYRGSNDAATLGGAPNISSVSITRRLWDTTNKNGRIELKIQPTSYTSNLDGLRYAKIRWYKQDKLPASSGPVVATLSIGANAFYDRVSGGTGSFITDGFVAGGTITIAGFANSSNNGQFLISTVTASRITVAITTQVTNESNVSNVTFTGNPVLTAVATTYETVPDRLYASTTDSNALNASFRTAQLMDSSITTGYPAVILTVYNASGPSDSHCYYSNTGAADGTDLVDNGTSFPASFSASGASGGSGGGTGGGGACPAPDVFLLMADGSYKLAGDIRVGDMLVAWDEESRSFVKEFVTFASPDTNDRWSISLSNGESGKFAHNHRFLLESGEWKELENLVPGEILFGGITVLSTEPDEVGPVVRITVNRVHTYITLGVISHNVKPIT